MDCPCFERGSRIYPISFTILHFYFSALSFKSLLINSLRLKKIRYFVSSKDVLENIASVFDFP